jgi:hypothetical protein
MFGNTAQTQILDTPQPLSLRIVFSAQAIGELTALCYPGASLEMPKRELAGFLFGSISDGSAVVETVRQLPSDGESAIFNRFTNKQFEEILRSGQADPTLESLHLIGWYRFHLKGDLRLDPVEIGFHEKFFPRHEQIGLLLRPEEPTGLAALVCARSQDGAFSRTQHGSASFVVNSRRIGRVAVDLQSGPKFGEETYIQAYRILDEAEPRTARRKWLMAFGIVVLCLGVAAIFLRLNSQPAATPLAETPAASLSLTLAGNGPNLLVTWAGGTSSPKQVHLKIYDGDAVSQIDLTKTYSPSGSITVPRHSGNVQAVITVDDGFHNWESQSSLIDESFASSLPRNGLSATPAPKSSASQSDIDQLKAQNQKLQTRIKALQRQIEYAPYRKRK